MSSVTVAASSASYRRGAPRLRERFRLASDRGVVDCFDLTYDDPRLGREPHGAISVYIGLMQAGGGTPGPHDDSPEDLRRSWRVRKIEVAS